MDQEIQPAPFLSQRGEHAINRAQILDVAGQHQRRADRLRQRLHPFAQRLALVGERQFRAVGGERLGDAPGDGVVVRHAHHQAALALHQSCCRCSAHYASNLLKTTEALVPPKPKELDSTQLI